MKHTSRTTVASGTFADTIYESDMDEENFSVTATFGIRERRRKLHTEAEQRRRNAIKRGFESLLDLVHPTKSPFHSHTVRMSKSTILYKAISMIEKLGKQNKSRVTELENLEKEVKALRILNSNYEKIARANACNNNKSIEPVLDDTKLRVFELFANSLFESFDKTVTLTAFPALSGFIINWMEDNCRAEIITSLMDSVLNEVFEAPPAELSAASSDNLLLTQRPVFNYSDYSLPMNMYNISDGISQPHLSVIPLSSSALAKPSIYNHDSVDMKTSSNPVSDLQTHLSPNEFRLDFKQPFSDRFKNTPSDIMQFRYKANEVESSSSEPNFEFHDDSSPIGCSERKNCPKSLIKDPNLTECLFTKIPTDNAINVSNELSVNKRLFPGKLMVHDTQYKQFIEELL